MVNIHDGRGGETERGPRMYRLIVAILTVSLVLAGCARAPQAPAEVQEVASVEAWQPIAPQDMNATQKAQQELVLSATNALASEMMGELTAALDSGSPDQAIGVCKTIAPAVAAQISEQFSLEIGRTSHKLRNPDNFPPEWAEAFVREVAEQPIYVVGPNGELGALLPIRLKAECQMCHGPVETIDDEILTAVKASYPSDQAVGFAEGDLRGWFWIETRPGEPEGV